MLKKYQIFVGATYNDLMEERSAAINQIIGDGKLWSNGRKAVELYKKGN